MTFKTDGKGVFPLTITFSWKATHPHRPKNVPSTAISDDDKTRQNALLVEGWGHAVMLLPTSVDRRVEKSRGRAATRGAPYAGPRRAVGDSP